MKKFLYYWTLLRCLHTMAKGNALHSTDVVKYLNNQILDNIFNERAVVEGLKQQMQQLERDVDALEEYIKVLEGRERNIQKEVAKLLETKSELIESITQLNAQFTTTEVPKVNGEVEA